MTTKTIVVLLVGLTLASVGLAEAQQPKKVPRIGFLALTPPAALSTRVEAFRKGLRELGYSEEKNISIDYRFAEAEADRLSDFNIPHSNDNCPARVSRHLKQAECTPGRRTSPS